MMNLVRVLAFAMSVGYMSPASALVTGRIIDQTSSTPISGALVHLVSANLSYTTGADGLFSFNIPSGVLYSNVPESLQDVTCANGSVSFTIASQQKRVSINIFDASGRQIAPAFSRTLSSGSYRFDVLSAVNNTTSSGILIARVLLDNLGYSFKIYSPPSGSQSRARNSLAAHTSNSALAKSAVAFDSIRVTKLGYAAVALPISSYSSALGDISAHLQSYALNLSCNPANGGTVTVNPNLQNYTYNTLATLTAVPASGYNFANWTGNASGTNASTQIAMTNNMNVAANFSLRILPKYTLTVTANPPAGGTVSLSPQGGTYDSGTVVTMSALPSSTFSFSGWSGSEAGTAASVQVAMTGNKSATANFLGIPQITGPSSTAANSFTIICTFNWGNSLVGSNDRIDLEQSTTSATTGFILLGSTPTGKHFSSDTFNITGASAGTYYYRARAYATNGFTPYSAVLSVNVTYQPPTLKITNDLYAGTSGGLDWSELNTVISVRIGASQTSNLYPEVLASSDVDCSAAGGNSILTGQSMQFNVASNAPNYYVYVQTGWWDYVGPCWEKHYASVLCTNGSCCCNKNTTITITNHNQGIYEIKLSKFLPNGNWNNTY
jgi:uncharacterized repeat protein (TIGR02543 family)